MYFVGDFNLNVLDYDKNKKIKNFFDLMFQHGLIPVINKPTRVTRRSASAIDHIVTNSFLNTKIKTGIIQTEVSDHFAIFLISENGNLSHHQDHITIFKRQINDQSINYFINLISEVDWNVIKETNDANKAYDCFLKLFLDKYEKAFPKLEFKIKTKNLLSPWMTKGLIKSSKKKKQLYEKFLKKRTHKNKNNYKNYKNLFETIKLRSKKFYYSSLISKYKNNIKKHGRL